MKIIHTADLHLGQIIYQNYDRVDEHEHFFAQLGDICREEQPDALVVSGDIFDIQQPSAAVKKFFNDHFVELCKQCPGMKLVITAGNHDSASRIQADSAIWKLANATLVGLAPSHDIAGNPTDWQKDFVVKTANGYIVALPYMSWERPEVAESVLEWVSGDNTDGKPVVMMGHLAVTGADPCGHSIEIGQLKTQSVRTLGNGYDYVALGHIHKPQTIGHQDDCMKEDVTYPSGVIRYSGSALHVSCDEKYPHTISIVEIDRHGGDVRIRQRQIDELRHFYELPLDGSSFTSSEEAMTAVVEFAEKHRRGYFRLRFDYNTVLASNFTNVVYDAISGYDDDIRFNPKHIWTGEPEVVGVEDRKPVFEVAELQQMTDPVSFIEKTKDQYPGLDMDGLRDAFEEVRKEMRRLAEEEREKDVRKTTGKTATVSATETVTEE